MIASLLRLIVVALLAVPTFAAAQPSVLVQDDLADLRPNEITGGHWTRVSDQDANALVCATSAGGVALTSRALNRRERDVCAASGSGTPMAMLIGRRAILAVSGGVRFNLTSELLYRALARQLPGADGGFATNRTMRWQELDPALPDQPIEVLLPPQHSAESRILTEIILYEGCSIVAGSALPADPVARFARCTTLRGDSAVAAAEAYRSVTAWLRGRGSAAIALIGVAPLLTEPDLQTALPLNGVMPGFSTIADGSYPGALPVWLLATMAPGDTAARLANLASSLLVESAIGPLGKLPIRGLAPVAAADRVKLRETFSLALDRAAH